MANLGDSTTYGNHVITGDLSVSGKGSLPIGATYLQLPSQSAPDDIFTGTWSNISSSYAGDFFRAEGGNALAFEAGEQDDELRAHTHGTVNIKNTTGWENWDSAYYGKGDNYGRGTSSSTGGSETRPVNKTIRLWKRIS